MSLVINHNMMAMNTARNLTESYGRLATSVQRLSTGMRINSAADDAAGLAIRETMRAEIAALNQGIRNAQDGISMIQTAEGALAVIDEKLIRMKELAEQAATGTYTREQRLIIHSEFSAMASEIDRIAESTEFNGIKLLNGQSEVAGFQGQWSKDNTWQANSVDRDDSTGWWTNNSGWTEADGAADANGDIQGGIKIHFGTTNTREEDYYFARIADARTESLFREADTLRPGDTAALPDTIHLQGNDLVDYINNLRDEGEYSSIQLAKDAYFGNLSSLDNPDISWVGNITAHSGGYLTAGSELTVGSSLTLTHGQEVVLDGVSYTYLEAFNEWGDEYSEEGMLSTHTYGGLVQTDAYKAGNITFNQYKLEDNPEYDPAWDDDPSGNTEGIPRRQIAMDDDGRPIIEKQGTVLIAGNQSQRQWDPRAEGTGVGETPYVGAWVYAAESNDVVVASEDPGDTDADAAAAAATAANIAVLRDITLDNGAIITFNFNAKSNNWLTEAAKAADDLLPEGDRQYTGMAVGDLISTTPSRGYIENVGNRDADPEATPPTPATGESWVLENGMAMASSDTIANASLFKTGSILNLGGQAEPEGYDARPHKDGDGPWFENTDYTNLLTLNANCFGVEFVNHHKAETFANGQLSSAGPIQRGALPSLLTQHQAQDALEHIDTAIARKENVRASLGAIQNRLENTITNLSIQAENLQASESRISDVDIANQMTEFVRNQVLTSAAVAMLGQANSLPQMALRLLG